MCDSSGVSRRTICESTEDDRLDSVEATSESLATATPDRWDRINKFVFSGCSTAGSVTGGTARLDTDTNDNGESDSAADECDGEATDTDVALTSVKLTETFVSPVRCRFSRFFTTFSIRRFFSSISERAHKFTHFNYRKASSIRLC